MIVAGLMSVTGLKVRPLMAALSTKIRMIVGVVGLIVGRTWSLAESMTISEVATERVGSLQRHEGPLEDRWRPAGEVRLLVAV